MQCWFAILASIVMQAVAASPDMANAVPRHSTHAGTTPPAVAVGEPGHALFVRPEDATDGDNEQVSSAPGGAEPVAGFSKLVNPVVPPTGWQPTSDGARGIAACMHSLDPRGRTLQAQHVRMQL